MYLYVSGFFSINFVHSCSRENWEPGCSIRISWSKDGMESLRIFLDAGGSDGHGDLLVPGNGVNFFVTSFIDVYIVKQVHNVAYKHAFKS